MIAEIKSACAYVNTHLDTRVLILTAVDPAFSSGGNVKDMKERKGMFAGTPAEIVEQYRKNLQDVLLSVYNVEIPTIAAINGSAVGAGCGLALMCDIRIASRKATFGETFLNVGLIPGDGSAFTLPRVIGMAKATARSGGAGAARDAAAVPARPATAFRREPGAGRPGTRAASWAAWCCSPERFADDGGAGRPGDQSAARRPDPARCCIPAAQRRCRTSWPPRWPCWWAWPRRSTSAGSAWCRWPRWGWCSPSPCSPAPLRPVRWAAASRQRWRAPSAPATRAARNRWRCTH